MAKLVTQTIYISGFTEETQKQSIMTKYEIAEKETYGLFDGRELDITGLSNAFDKFAKQQSIAFAEWMHKESWVTAFYKETPMHYQLYKEGEVNKIRYATPEQLYNLFIEASTK